MGLSGRKVKQRIPNDPRNLSWADDAAKFGQAYLAKMGWDPSKGLGASGEGRTRAISVDQKLDMLGIGMQHQRDANGLAWQQNRDFENLLKRLNGAAEGATEEDGIKGEMKGIKKARKGEKEEDGGLTSDNAASAAPAVPIVAPTPVRAPPRTHRARIIAAKRLASRTPAALSEILGIPSSSIPATPAAPSPLSTLTPSAPATPADAAADLQKLTTATQSVADYFKAKLAARARGSGSATPVVKEETRDEEDDAPRMGLGASRSRSAVFDERGSAQAGIEASSKFGAVFSAAQDADHTKVEEAPATDSVQAEGGVEGEDEKSMRKRAKEERRKEKARRKQERERDGGE
ncbi:hypothetical protein HETIRDRAFT_57064 [Heterobasidion irregulare TC 32-1]|uniref:G-patch domain-containing protein n=1 Tax=Heterobasidion irregulare (strain TC 32-1) TaxID=747525 RepID=W4JPM4_HETIT|nr:uncharacterized protein HETIRDRAFT_57064 [Heterobasidion irregulare TC 32-1]ETW75040.1 hypothetical protein HETIRDRAFT_57064 [Heterobasidion irregulare TC 32-1]